MAEDLAVRSYRVAAAKGDAKAQFALGCAYANGRRVAQNSSQAITWYRKAAAQGHSGAQNNLGWMYDRGHGVTKDSTEAAKWYLMAARNGSAFAQNNIGIKYEKGDGVEQNRELALRWYRAAADQGNEDAEKNLARLLASPPPAQPPPLRPPQPPPLKNPSPKERIRARVRHTIVHNCKPLLEASTPTVYRHNAFRITGLTVDATPREIKRRIDDLKAAEEMGDAEEEHCHAFALEPPPTLEGIREAAARLRDPERRFIEEFFWFWPVEWGSGKRDPAIRSLLNGDKNTAFTAWKRALTNHGGPVTATAKHNLAVMYQLVALDSEHYALTEDLEEDQHETISEYWRTCFKWWEELSEDEVFWSLVTDRIRMLDDPRLTTGFARRMRASLPAAMDKINAMLAISFIEQGKDTLAEQQVEYMLETHQGRDDVAGTMAAVASPLLSRVRTAIEQAEARIGASSVALDRTAENLIHVAQDPVRVLRKFLPDDDVQLVDVCDAVAATCMKCQRSHVRETEDWLGSVQILESAHRIAASQDMRKAASDALQNARRDLALATHGEPIAARLQEIGSLSDHAVKLGFLEREIIPQLDMLSRDSASSYAHEACADLVASFLRELSVAIFNESGNVPLAKRALHLALGLARDSSLITRLNEDQVQLGNIEKEAHAHDLDYQIRSDKIQITQAGIRYNNQRIAAKDLDGVRFGIYVEYTNGVQSDSSYRIDYHSRKGSVINIECKRAFFRETKARAAYHAILDATLHQLVPGIVTRVAGSIAAGKDSDMGGGCILTRDGVRFSTGMLMWKKEHLIPYKEVIHLTKKGFLGIGSATDEKARITLSLRDNWNAVLFEHIVKVILDRS